VLTHPKYSKFTPADWALLWIQLYGGFDQAHHKDWVLAQVARILNNTEVIVKTARWDTGQEEDRFTLAEDSEQFKAWRMAVEGEVYSDGSTEWEFSDGIPP
jgi:hypothetical protein